MIISKAESFAMEPQEIIDKAIQLKKDCLSCKKCSLCENIVDGVDPHVYGYGNLASPIMVISEAPGLDETIKKIPLIGKAGQVFEKYVLGGLELKREDVWTTNTCLCRPPNNRKPTPEEREACLPHLQAQLALIKPKLVVLLGATPMSVFLGIESGITKLAGQKFTSQRFNVDCFICFHPSYILRTGQYNILQEHVKVLKPLIYNMLDG